MTFQEADAEQLPFADAGFDIVLSTVGAMFPLITRARPVRCAAFAVLAGAQA